MSDNEKRTTHWQRAAAKQGPLPYTGSEPVNVGDHASRPSKQTVSKTGQALHRMQDLVEQTRLDLERVVEGTVHAHFHVWPPLEDMNRMVDACRAEGGDIFYSDDKKHMWFNMGTAQIDMTFHFYFQEKEEA